MRGRTSRDGDLHYRRNSPTVFARLIRYSLNQFRFIRPYGPVPELGDRSYNFMDSFFEFSLFCLRAPMNELECGPLWLVVSFAAIGTAATVAVLLVQSYRDWCRWRAWCIGREGRASKDDSALLNDPDYVDAVRGVVRRRADRRKTRRTSTDRRSAQSGLPPGLHPG